MGKAAFPLEKGCFEILVTEIRCRYREAHADRKNDQWVRGSKQTKGSHCDIHTERIKQIHSVTQNSDECDGSQLQDSCQTVIFTNDARTYQRDRRCVGNQSIGV